MLLFFACSSPNPHTHKTIRQASIDTTPEATEIEKYYQLNAMLDKESAVYGSVSNGSIENAHLIPFNGNNYSYFDRGSYLAGRAYSHSKVIDAIVDTYKNLEGNNRKYYIMEMSLKEGGKMFPHRTHQNGMSADFMMPKTQYSTECYKLDTLGIMHYLLSFDNQGKYQDDKSIEIDFDAVTEHLLVLNKKASENGLRIVKVIFNTDLQDELFDSKNGEKLRSSGIYFTKVLEKKINDLHDDHYHVDFALI